MLAEQKSGGIDFHGADCLNDETARRRTDRNREAQCFSRDIFPENIRIVLIGYDYFLCVFQSAFLKGRQSVDALAGDDGLPLPIPRGEHSSFKFLHDQIPSFPVIIAAIFSSLKYRAVEYVLSLLLFVRITRFFVMGLFVNIRGQMLATFTPIPVSF